MALVFGLFLFALAIVLILESKLGLSPWDVLNQGLSRHSPLSFGMANVAVGLVSSSPRGRSAARRGSARWRTPYCRDLHPGAACDPRRRGLEHDPLAVRIVLLAAGIPLIGVGSAFYIGADYGAGRATR